MKKTSKLYIPGEIVYLVGISLLSLSVAITAASDIGLSMIAAPSYILSLGIDALSFGQCEYIVEGAVFIALCIAMRRVRLTYFFAFLSGVLYGAMLDLWRTLIPMLDPSRTPPGSMTLPIRIIMFVIGIVMTAFSVALTFHTYLTPAVLDFFVKAVSERYHLPLTGTKTAFDGTFLFLSAALTLIFFREIRGIGIGTVIITLINGPLIGLFDRFFSKRLDNSPIFAKAEKIFQK